MYACLSPSLSQLRSCFVSFLAYIIKKIDNSIANRGEDDDGRLGHGIEPTDELTKERKNER